MDRGAHPKQCCPGLSMKLGEPIVRASHSETVVQLFGLAALDGHITGLRRKRIGMVLTERWVKAIFDQNNSKVVTFFKT